MKKLLPFALLLVLIALALPLLRGGQQAVPSTYVPQLISFPGVPTGVCDIYQIALNNSNGQYYSCKPITRTWNAIASVSGSVTSGQVAFASATNVISGDSNFTWDNTAKSLTVTNSGLSGIAPIYALALGVTTNEAGIVAQCQQLANNFCEGGQFVASDSGAGPIGSVIGIASVPSHTAAGTLATMTGIDTSPIVGVGTGAITTSRGIHVGGVSFPTGTSPTTHDGIIVDDQCSGSFPATNCTGIRVAAQSNGKPGVTAGNINGILYIGTGQYTSLQAAHDALPSTGGTIRISPVYIDTETITVNVTKPNVTIECQNQPHFSDATNAGITFNHTSVGINVTGKNFGMDGCELKIGTTTTRVGVPLIDSNATEGGRLSNLLLVGQGASANNGIFFRSTDTSVRQGIWQLDNIINRDGATWTSIATVSIASNTLTGAYYKFTDIVNSYAEKYTDAAIVLDGTIDTVEMDRISTGQALATGGKTIWIRNTVSASGIGYPRWVHCNNCYLEAGGNVGGVSLQIDSGRDINYSGYIASSTNCVNQTNAFVGVNIHDTAFTNIFGTCIAITGGTGTTIHHNNFADLQQGDITYAGGGGVLIDGNTFRNDSAQTTNTYDTIQLAAGTGLAQITSNNWLNQGTPKPRYGINFLGNFNASVIGNNNYAGVTFGTAFLNPPANNLNMQIIGQDATVIGKLTSTLTAIGFYSNLAGACTNGELALSAGWQSTGAATVTAVAGIGQTCNWTITTGTTTGANPTVTDTLVNALPVATIVCEMNIHGGTHTAAAGEGFTQTSLSTTAPVFTFIGTPTAGGTTYFVTRRCGP